MPENVRLERVDTGDTTAGVVICQWFARQRGMERYSPDRVWIDLGEGKGWPSFAFISDGEDLRLFRIAFFANNEYYPGIQSALLRNYGPPQNSISSFQVRAGSKFSNLTSRWSNGVSSIVLEHRCERVDTYCLTYRHRALGRIYDDLVEARAAAAASKI
jgi:hypothetical protein